MPMWKKPTLGGGVTAPASGWASCIHRSSNRPAEPCMPLRKSSWLVSAFRWPRKKTVCGPMLGGDIFQRHRRARHVGNYSLPRKEIREAKNALVEVERALGLADVEADVVQKRRLQVLISDGSVPGRRSESVCVSSDDRAHRPTPTHPSRPASRSRRSCSSLLTKKIHAIAILLNKAPLAVVLSP